MRFLPPALLIALAPNLALAQSGALKSAVRKTRAQADRALERGAVDEAAASYQKLLFAGFRKVGPRYRKLRRKQVRQLLGEAKEAFKVANRERGLTLLRRAYVVDPSARSVRAAFKKQGLTRFRGRFLSKAQIAAAKEADKKRGRERLAEIGLRNPQEFTILRRGVFRFYTNIDVRQARGVLKQMTAAVQTHYRKYCQVMQMAGIRYPEQGLDVVLFKDERGYLQHVKRSGTAGLYDPNKGVGYFFAGSGGFNFPTMLHEMTHQLNHKVLNAMSVTPWFEEGIAEYFGSGVLSRGGRRIQLGRPDAGRMSDFRSLLLAKPCQVTPLARFLSHERAELSSGYYAQSWAVVQYLMTGPVQGRLIVFDMILAAKQKQSKTRFATLGVAEMKKILGSYGMTLERFEQRYLAFHRGKGGSSRTR